MKETGNLLLWLTEAVQRLKQQSPAFFKVLNQAQTIILLIAGLPTVFLELQSMGVLPENWQSLVPEMWLKVLFRIISFCAMWGLLVSKLTVLRQPVSVTPQGKIINVTEPEKLPFSAKKEAAKVEEAREGNMDVLK